MYESDYGNCVKDTAPIMPPTINTRHPISVDDGLDTTVYLMQSTFSTVLKASLEAVEFSHDMLLNIFPSLHNGKLSPNQEE